MKLVITNPATGVTSTTPFVVRVDEVEDGFVIETVLPTQRLDDAQTEFIKWDAALTYQLQK